MGKYQVISTLLEDTIRQISRNKQEWTKYLDTAARLYRYPYEDQMPIYAQKPDARACATIETWNEKMFCWVNRGAKGIALFDRESKRPRLKYVFDVSDVHKAKRIGKDLYLWEMREEHKDTVIVQLEKTYGVTNNSLSFEGRLIEIAEKIAEDYYKELLQDMFNAKKGSFLEELDDLNVGMRLRETLSASIAYTLLSRCGADMDLWKDELNFDYICEFNTPMALSIVGNATTDMCKSLLMEIGRTVVDCERQIVRRNVLNKAKEVQVGDIDKNTKNVLANTPESRYNALKRESKLQNGTIINHIETGGRAHGTDIREEWRVSDTQPDTRQRAGGAADQVRSNADELSEGTPEGNLQWTADDGQVENALSRDTGAGRAENGLPDGSDDENRGSGRSAKSIRSDEVGGKNEQHQALSRGNRTDRVGLRPLSSQTQQNMETEKPDSEKHSLFGSFLQIDKKIEPKIEV